MRVLSIITLAIILNACASSQIVTVSIPKKGIVVDAKGTKDELYVRSNAWMVKSFNNAKSVIQFQDKESGKIIGKYLLRKTFGDDIFSIITISIKDNTTKIEIEPMGDWQTCTNCNSGYESYKSYSSDQANYDIKLLINSFTDFITTKEEGWKNTEVDNTKKIITSESFAFYIEGNKKFSLQDFPGAINDFTRSLEFSPKYTSALYSRGLAYLQMGIYNKGCQDLKDALELGSQEANKLIKRSCKN